MSRSKKIFLVFAAIFITIMLIIMHDIARKTTFPGGNKKEKQSIQENDRTDSLKSSIKENQQ